MGDDVGSGAEFGADLFLLFRAGKIEMPAAATTYETLANNVDGNADTLAGIANELQHPAGFKKLEETRAILQYGLAKSSIHIDEAADALVQIATEYAATDDEANQVFQQRLEDLTGQDEKDAEAPDTDPSPPLHHTR